MVNPTTIPSRGYSPVYSLSASPGHTGLEEIQLPGHTSCCNAGKRSCLDSVTSPPFTGLSCLCEVSELPFSHSPFVSAVTDTLFGLLSSSTNVLAVYGNLTLQCQAVFHYLHGELLAMLSAGDSVLPFTPCVLPSLPVDSSAIPPSQPAASIPDPPLLGMYLPYMPLGHRLMFPCT